MKRLLKLTEISNFFWAPFQDSCANFNFSSRKLFSFFLTFFICCNSNAGVFRIDNRVYGNVVDANLQSQIDTAFDAIETQVNSQLTQFDASEYLKGVANSTPISSSGGTEDHASRFKIFYVALTGGLGADLGGASLNSLSSSTNDLSNFKGLTGSYQLTFGTKASYFHIPKWRFINPEMMKFYFGMAQTNLTQGGVDFSFASYSFMVQHHFLNDFRYGWGLFGWNGILVSTGIKYSRLQVLFSKTFSQTSQQNLTAPPINPTLTVDYTSTVSIGAKSTMTTIPIDISSSINFLYMFDLYAGLGADLNVGSAESIIKAPGKVTATETSGTLGTMSGDIIFDLGDKKSPQNLDGRYYLGGAWDFRILSLGLQYTKAVTNNSQGISFQFAAHF